MWKKIKTIFAFLLFIAIILAGINFFIDLKKEKEIYNTELFGIMPKDSYSILCINHTFDWVNKKFSGHSAPSVFLQDKSLQTLNLICRYYGHRPSRGINRKLALTRNLFGSLLYIKDTPENILYVENSIFREIFSPYPYRSKIYKDTEIRIQAAENDSFFSYILYKGLIIGSYDLRAICHEIDILQNGANLLKNTSFKNNAKNISEDAAANLFIRSDSDTSLLAPTQEWISGDININNDGLYIYGMVKGLSGAGILELAPDSDLQNRHIRTALIPSNYKSITCTFYHPAERKNLLKGKYLNFSDSILMNALAGEAGICSFYEKRKTLKEERNIAFLKIDKYKFNIRIPELIKRSNYKDSLYTGLVHTPLPYPAYYSYQTTMSLGINRIFGKYFPVNRKKFFTIYDEYLLIANEQESINEYLHQIREKKDKKILSSEIVKKKNDDEDNTLSLVNNSEDHPSLFYWINRLNGLDIRLGISVKNEKLYYNCIIK